MKIKLGKILNSKMFPLSNGDYNVFDVDGIKIAVSGTVIASSGYAPDIEIDIDKLQKRNITYQDYKDEFQNNPIIIDQQKNGMLKEDYLDLLLNADILKTSITENIPMLLSYDISDSK